MDRSTRPDLPDGPGFWLAMAAIPAALGAASITIGVTEYHPPWSSAWFISGAVLCAVGGLCAIWSLILYLARKQAWAAYTTRELERQDRARELKEAIGDGDKDLPNVGQVTDRALLGIHPSIPLPSSADRSLSPDLPLYIPRDIDADLRAWITAHQESGGFLLLVGPAASGKTRCAYELAREMLADWPMFMPSTPTQVTKHVEADPVAGKLVIWLDETQKFLGASGLTTATVRRVLARPYPAIIIGTMWPQRYDTLTSQSGSLSDTQQDVREILTMIAQRKDLLPGFSRTELNRARSLANRDPRIAEAITQTTSMNLPEILAAAPDLIGRWLNAADPYGAAVITAAVIARRCGHPEPLPRAVLEPIAETMLTPGQRGLATPEWFPAALKWARTPVRGPAAPLAPQATTPGVIQGDQVSDVLVQHAARQQDVPGHVIAESTWLLLIDKATPQACRAIADVVYQQQGHEHPSPITEHAIRKAAEAGDAGAMFNLGFLLVERGETDQAEQWYGKAAEAGHTGGMYNLGNLLDAQGETDQAEQWYGKAAEAGHTEAMYNLGNLLLRQGKKDQAEQWYGKAANAGDVIAMSNLGNLLARRGKKDQAEQWYRKAAEAGDVIAMSKLGALLARRGKKDQAEQWYRKAAEAGHTDPMYNLAIMLANQRKKDQAEQWHRKAAEAEPPSS